MGITDPAGTTRQGPADPIRMIVGRGMMPLKGGVCGPTVLKDEARMVRHHLLDRLSYVTRVLDAHLSKYKLDVDIAHVIIPHLFTLYTPTTSSPCLPQPRTTKLLSTTSPGRIPLFR